jgi:hypothetical protein
MVAAAIRGGGLAGRQRATDECRGGHLRGALDGGGAPVRLWLRGGVAMVAVLAWDATLSVPVPRAAGGEEESGRGLAIVAALSADCGFYYPAHYPGKVTWAVIDTP